MAEKTSSSLLDQIPEENLESSGAEDSDPVAVPPVFDLRISRDKITVLLDCPDPHANLATHVTQIMTDFGDLEIPEFPDTEHMTTILAESCSPGEHLREHVVIMGVAPVPTIPGRLEWAREFFTAGWKLDENTGSMDFWQKLEECAVHEDELLVTLYHPVPGEPGLNVFGNDVPVEKPAKIKLRCGKGVRTEELDGGMAYYAAVNGRVRHLDGTVSVDDVYTIKGNVNLETGNINHTGSVVVDGDIESGATVEAEGDILIKGMAETCDIRCGGSLTVAGGILGSPDHPIHVEGNIQAKYISEALILAQGDVTVLNEIAHSDIRTRGKVQVESGRIAGGTTIALQGIRIAEAGASGSTLTLLAAGVDFTLDGKLEPFKQRIQDLEKAQEKMTAATSKIKGSPDGQTKKGKTMLANMAQQDAKIAGALGEMAARIESTTQEAMASAVDEVLILREIWSGTTIQLGKYKLVVNKSIMKPRIAQAKRKKVRLLPLGDGNLPEE